MSRQKKLIKDQGLIDALSNDRTHKRWIVQQLLFADVLEELERIFQDNAIRFMPIKGAYLIATGLMEKIENRPLLDIDLLVHPKDFDRVRSIFGAGEKIQPVENYWPFEYSFWYNVGFSRVYIEIHHQLNFRERFLLPTEELFERACRHSSVMFLPSEVDALVIFLCHSLVHIGHDLPPTVFREAMVLSRGDGFSWEEFVGRIKKTGVQSYAGFFLRWAAREENAECPGLIPCNPYGLLCARYLTYGRYKSLPALIRRVFLELPFARQPMRLLFKRLKAKVTS